MRAGNFSEKIRFVRKCSCIFCFPNEVRVFAMCPYPKKNLVAHYKESTGCFKLIVIFEKSMYHDLSGLFIKIGVPSFLKFFSIFLF